MTMITARAFRARLLKAVVVVALVFVAAFFITNSFARAVVKSNSAIAYAISPYDGAIVSRYAEDAFALKPDADEESENARLAEQAILADPTRAEALTVLGFQAQLRGETEKAERIFAYALSLTRRELRPHIWGIEDEVTRGNIEGALRHYDLALRTTKRARPLLFPTLVAAMSEPRIRKELLHLILKDPDWTADFFAYAADSGIEPVGTSFLFSEAAAAGVEIGEGQRSNLVNRLYGRGELDDAWRVYQTLRPDAISTKSRDPEFALATDARAVFDWRLGEDAGLSSVILKNGDKGVLEFSTAPSVGGRLVSQAQLLSPGAYKFDGLVRDLQQSGRSQPYWVLSCRDGRELLRIDVPNAQDRAVAFTGRFIVPSSCRAQVLSLIARPSDDIMGVSGRIERAEISPSNRDAQP